ncbi:unnamed protein product, partial [Owenia fusiformis]
LNLPITLGAKNKMPRVNNPNGVYFRAVHYRFFKKQRYPSITPSVKSIKSSGQFRAPNRTSCKDVYDGSMYQVHFRPGGLLQNPNNISLLWHLDGGSVFN